MGTVTMGLDVGQKADPSAICVAEAEPRELIPYAPTSPEFALATQLAAERAKLHDGPVPGPHAMHHVVRRIERIPLGTNYVAVADRVRVVAAGVINRTRSAPLLFVDATGVGTPIVDMLFQAKVEAIIVPVYFTHGDRRIERKDKLGKRFISLGKAWLVSRLQALFQSVRIHLPHNAETDALIRELLDYEIKIDDNANDRYGAFKVGAHDDMVTAIGLATQQDAGVSHFDAQSVKTSPILPGVF